VLDKNLFKIPAKEILNTKVDLTILGGKVVYRRKQ
jgi:predicted amidohydrolase YtcJ